MQCLMDDFEPDVVHERPVAEVWTKFMMKNGHRSAHFENYHARIQLGPMDSVHAVGVLGLRGNR